MFQEIMFHDCMLRRLIFQIYSVSGPDPVSVDLSREVCLCLAGQTLQEGNIGTLQSLKFSDHSGGASPWLLAFATCPTPVCSQAPFFICGVLGYSNTANFGAESLGTQW